MSVYTIDEIIRREKYLYDEFILENDIRGFFEDDICIISTKGYNSKKEALEGYYKLRWPIELKIIPYNKYYFLCSDEYMYDYDSYNKTIIKKIYNNKEECLKKFNELKLDLVSEIEEQIHNFEKIFNKIGKKIDVEVCTNSFNSDDCYYYNVYFENNLIQRNLLKLDQEETLKQINEIESFESIINEYGIFINTIVEEDKNLVNCYLIEFEKWFKGINKIEEVKLEDGNNNKNVGSFIKKYFNEERILADLISRFK